MSGTSLSSLPNRPANRPHQSSMSSTTSSHPSTSSHKTPQSSRTISRSAVSSPTRSTFNGPPPSIPPRQNPGTSQSQLMQPPQVPPKVAPPPQAPRNIAPSRSMQQLSTAVSNQTLAEPDDGRRQASMDMGLGISPVASRMRQRDADAIAHFMSRNPLAASTSAVDTRPLAEAPPPSPVHGARHRFMRSILRPSVSAMALRQNSESDASTTPTNSRLRSTTLDNAPPGSGNEYESISVPSSPLSPDPMQTPRLGQQIPAAASGNNGSRSQPQPPMTTGRTSRDRRGDAKLSALDHFAGAIPRGRV